MTSVPPLPSADHRREGLIVAALNASLTAFRDQVSPEDDVTLVVVRVN